MKPADSSGRDGSTGSRMFCPDWVEGHRERVCVNCFNTSAWVDSAVAAGQTNEETTCFCHLFDKQGHELCHFCSGLTLKLSFRMATPKLFSSVTFHQKIFSSLFMMLLSLKTLSSLEKTLLLNRCEQKVKNHLQGWIWRSASRCRVSANSL